MKHRIWKFIDQLVGFHRHCICQDEDFSSMCDGRYSIVVLKNQVMIPLDEDAYQRGYDDALSDNEITAIRGDGAE